MSEFTVEVVPYASDNYSYLLIGSSGTAGTEAALVDCGEAAPVISRLKSMGLALNAVLICHTHSDHVAGLPSLLHAYPDAVVYAPTAALFIGGKEISGVNRVSDGSVLSFGSAKSALSLTVLGVPAHTKQCINYYAPGFLFTSDTLFSAGCGRLFEGTASELCAAMDRLSSYPLNTCIYFGHEYTAQNLRFALSVEPDNPDIKEYIKEVDSIMAKGGVTTPGTIGHELRVNPFFRIDIDAVIDFVDPERRFTRVERLGLLRRAKDRF